MATVHKVWSIRTTWHGRKGELIEHRLRRNSLGLRLTVMTFEGDTFSTVELVDGDGRKPSFVKHFSQEVKLADVEAFVSTTIKNIP